MLLVGTQQAEATRAEQVFIAPAQKRREIFLIKGYLCYKTITSQNVRSEAQVKNCFVSYKSYVLFSRYSSVCIFNHSMIYEICDVIMSIITWDRVHFPIYLLMHQIY